MPQVNLSEEDIAYFLSILGHQSDPQARELAATMARQVNGVVDASLGSGMSVLTSIAFLF